MVYYFCVDIKWSNHCFIIFRAPYSQFISTNKLKTGYRRDLAIWLLYISFNIIFPFTQNKKSLRKRKRWSGHVVHDSLKQQLDFMNWTECSQWNWTFCSINSREDLVLKEVNPEISLPLSHHVIKQQIAIIAYHISILINYSLTVYVLTFKIKLSNIIYLNLKWENE